MNIFQNQAVWDSALFLVLWNKVIIVEDYGEQKMIQSVEHEQTYMPL